MQEQDEDFFESGEQESGDDEDTVSYDCTGTLPR